MDIVVWLRSLSLGKYEAAFRSRRSAPTARSFRSLARWSALLDLHTTTPFR